MCNAASAVAEASRASIDEARKFADFVIVAHHFNIADGKRGDKTPMFVREFARAAIDAGPMSTTAPLGRMQPSRPVRRRY